jgi:translation initiation factor 1
MAKRSGSPRVYSTDPAARCPGCLRLLAECVCANPPASAPVAPKQGVVRVGRESKGRKGAGVTVITGLALPPDALKALAQKLKKRCGVGGAIKDGVIELQGEQRDAACALLEAEGFSVKRAGG